LASNLSALLVTNNSLVRDFRPGNNTDWRR
jgi:hypothetical protein